MAFLLCQCMLSCCEVSVKPESCAGVPLDDEGQYGAEAIVNTAAIDVLRRMPVWHTCYVMDSMSGSLVVRTVQQVQSFMLHDGLDDAF